MKSSVQMIFDKHNLSNMVRSNRIFVATILLFVVHLSFSQSGKVLKDKSLLVEYTPTREVEGDRHVEFGAVYFRRSNPAKEDWERDYKQAATDGHSVFRHWFSWNAINTAPGEYNWEPYDPQLDLAAKYGIKTVIGEFVKNAPDWVFHKYPGSRKETIEGRKHSSDVYTSTLTGRGGMCEDSPEIRSLGEKFLTEMVKRYKDHPGLYGYDLLNEYTYYRPANFCYCPHTEKKFQGWLKEKYDGSLENLGDAWFRFSYTAWDEVRAPRKLTAVAEVFDWMEFNSDNLRDKLRWRVNVIKRHDPDAMITAHGNANSHKDYPASGDDYVAGRELEIFGYTYGRLQRYNLLLSGDMTRMASHGREFWRAEAAGNTGWVGRQEDREPFNHRDFDAGKFYMALDLEDQHNYPENLRIEAYVTLVSGARGFLSPRWRPLMDGPYMGGYAWYNDDGTPNKRSEMIASIAHWANQPGHKELWEAKPIRGEVGLLMLQESQAFNFGIYNNTHYFAKSYEGAFEAFYDANIQADPIQLDQVGNYDFIYVPYPMAMSDETVNALLKWIESGGTLVLEGMPGFVTEHAKELEKQPNRGLERATGCEQLKVHFGPDRWADLQVHSDQGFLPGSLVRQSFTPTSGKVIGRYGDGTAAIVENEYGKGKAIVIGTMPGYAYLKNKNEGARRWFESLLRGTGKSPHLSTPYNTEIVARINASEKGVFLWLMNVSSCDQKVQVFLNQTEFKVNRVESRLGAKAELINGNGIQVFVEERDAVIVQLF